VVNDEPE
jgi:hypothetical protein